MVFSSTFFLFVFLPIVIFLYFMVRPELKNILLLFASFFFYFWGEPKFFFILLLSILINYVGGILLGVLSKHAKRKNVLLIFFVTLNLLLLFVFKYLDFSISVFNKFSHFNIKKIGILLPIGISFFTFQGMSYLIDVYRNDSPPQKNFVKLALYISMFPQMIAGPIVRYQTVCREIDARTMSLQDFSDGAERFIFGLAKKVLLANGLAEVVDEIYKIPAMQNTQVVAWIGVVFYSLQLYFDFSGYSDMAIGLGKIFGFHFCENFDYPYKSKSISEFWRRWHISLSSWFRDYLYIPLGGSRKGNVYINLMIVFLCTGIWHGAALNFFVWGGWHGLFIVFERFLKNKLPVHNIHSCIWAAIQRLYTALVVLIGWVFFRSESLSYAVDTLKIMFGLKHAQCPLFDFRWYLNPYSISIFVISLALSFGMFDEAKKKMSKIKESIVYKGGAYMLILLLFFLSAGFVIISTYNPFIYFRF